MRGTPRVLRSGQGEPSAIVEPRGGLYDGDARFPTRLAARTAIFEFIKVFSNRRRLHSSIDYVSPDVFEIRFRQDQEDVTVA